MSQPTIPRNVVTPDRFDAVLFDLDGVLTSTAEIHAACWKEMFDGFLRRRAEQVGETFRPFDVADEYRLHVDGKPRLDGVRDFLRSRGIELPEGQAVDAPGDETLWALGNRKNELVHAALDRGVEPYPGSVAFVRQVRERGLHTAVVSSSRNCARILRAAGLEKLFELSVDGEVAARLALRGKPAPDTFLHAARGLGVEPSRTAVVEDAIVGVQAGRAGNFGLVIGVARHGDAAELREHGADIVVEDLGQIAS